MQDSKEYTLFTLQKSQQICLLALEIIGELRVLGDEGAFSSKDNLRYECQLPDEDIFCLSLPSTKPEQTSSLVAMKLTEAAVVPQSTYSCKYTASNARLSQ